MVNAVLTLFKKWFYFLTGKTEFSSLFIKNELAPVPRYSNCTVYSVQFTELVQLSPIEYC